MTATHHRSTTDTSSTRQYHLVPPATTVRFTTRHLFGMAAVTGSVRVLEGSATTAGEDLVSIAAVLDAASFESSSRARDKVVTSATLLDVATHPHLTYRSTEVERRAGGWLVHGQLTVKGVTAAVDLLVDRPQTTGDGPVHATARVNRFDHGITLPTAFLARYLEIDVVAGVADALTPSDRVNSPTEQR